MKIRRVDLYADDFLTGTSMLSDDEMGVYWRICLLIYATGGPVSLEHVKSVCKSHGNTFNRCIARLESLGKITRNGQEIDQKRCANELERSRKRLGKQSENLSKANETRKLARATASEKSFPTEQQSTINNQHTKAKAFDEIADEPASKSQSGDLVKVVFDSAIRILTGSGIPERHARSVAGKWRKQIGDDGRLIGILLAVEKESVIDPIGYISKAVERASWQGGWRPMPSPAGG